MKQNAIFARSIVVVAPHPDDEAIGAWGLIRQARSRGARIHIIVVSDGGASHPESAKWPSERLTKERRRESTRAMRHCKLAPYDITFLSMPDGQLSASEAKLSRILAARLRRCRPHLIVGPSRNDEHADHRAVAETLVRLRVTGARKIAYHVWPAGRTRGRVVCSVSLSSVQMARKRCGVRGYRTQMGMITDANGGFTMSHRHLAAFVRPREEFTRL